MIGIGLLLIIGFIIVVIIGCIGGFIYYLSKDKKDQPTQNNEMGHLSNRIKALEVDVADLKGKLTDHKHDS
jgi:flagellar basal body-associated protein FliL